MPHLLRRVANQFKTFFPASCQNSGTSFSSIEWLRGVSEARGGERVLGSAVARRNRHQFKIVERVYRTSDLSSGDYIVEIPLAWQITEMSIKIRKNGITL